MVLLSIALWLNAAGHFIFEGARALRAVGAIACAANRALPAHKGWNFWLAFWLPLRPAIGWTALKHMPAARMPAVESAGSAGTI
jgi:hypothetical protein